MRSYLDTPRRAGYDEAVPQRYLDRVVAATGATIGNVPGTIEMSAEALLDNRAAFLDAATAYVDDLRAEA